MKLFKRLMSSALAAILAVSTIAVANVTMVSAAPSVSGGWNETLYAEWRDSNPDSTAVKVGYKLSTDSAYTYLSGDDYKYLIRPASTSGYGRVDIPGLKEGRYDITITASDGTVHNRNGIKVYAYDRSGYAHWTPAGAGTYEGVGAYNNDGTPKDNAIVIYVTDENKDTVTIPGYENAVWSYTPSKDPAYTRTSEGVGNILNNNYKFIDDVTSKHPLIIRFVGKVNVPKNLTPYNVKDPILGGAKGDNGNLAITKWGRNITLEGIGDDAEFDGWGFTVAKTDTHPADSGKNIEVRNIIFRNYTEDGLGFQGEGDSFVERVWVHNNIFYPGYCANPAEGDKGDGDGSCDFKRGRYYTMSYNHFLNCHKTNLLGSGGSDSQWYMTLHHNWYENVASRQPLAANGNVHIYNTYFQNSSSETVDTRNKNATFLEANYYENCKRIFKSRNDTCYAKSYNEKIAGGDAKLDEKGTRTVVTDRAASVIKDNGFKFPDGSSMADFDTNPNHFYYDAVNKVTDVEVLTPVEEVPEYVKTYAGNLRAFPETESGLITITVKTEKGVAVTDASVTANGITFKHTGNGVYTADAALGAEYTITVSKKGYTNVVINSTVITEDGGEFKADAVLKEDYDGYAVVKLTGGADNAPVIGATVTLDDNTVLVDQNDGTYKSASQLPLGERTVTITNTGDYIAPAGPQKIVIETTDEATEIHLEKMKGAVSVTLKAADGSAKELDAASALVYVGNTQLTYAGDNTFTGNVDINTSFAVSASMGGWKVISIEPSQLVASRETTASAVVTLQEGGEQYTWNLTDGTNTEDFFEFSSGMEEWGDAKKNPQEYDGYTLTKAYKMSSSRYVTFNAPADGTLVIIAHNRDKEATISINDGDAQSIAIGENGPYEVKAGTVTIKRVKGEPCFYFLRYTITGEYTPPTPPVGDDSTTTTETTTETTTYSVPVDLDTDNASSNNGESGISVTYNEATDTWTLTDKSTTLAAKLNIPFAEPITSGKVVVSGKVTPTKASGKWSFLKVTGPNGADGEPIEVAAVATDSNKNITLRTDGTTYASSSVAVTANKTYNYEFIIDMDAKTVSLNIDGKTYTGAFTADSITGIGAITAVSDDSRNVSLTTPYVGIITDAPEPPVQEGLSDEIMWDIEKDLSGTSNGLTFGEEFFTNEDENAPEFKDGDESYTLPYYLQSAHNPTDSRGVGPMSPDTGNGGPTGIPVSGGFVQFAPEKDGVFTVAIKTNGGKQTYITDETGSVIKEIDADSTSYDIIRFNVKAGKTYYIFAQGSRACFYYLGYTSGISVPEDPTVTESSSETTSSETSSETPTDPTPQDPEDYGDSNNNGVVEISDVVDALQYVLSGKPFAKEFKYIDVNSDGKIDSADVAMILQHVLDKSYTLPR